MDETLALNIDPEDARTIDRKGVRMPRVEVITRGDRRRVWTLEQKREIVAESLGPDLTPTEVARKHGISSGLLYGWRQKLLSGLQQIIACRLGAGKNRRTLRHRSRDPRPICRAP